MVWGAGKWVGERGNFQRSVLQSKLYQVRANLSHTMHLSISIKNSTPLQPNIQLFIVNIDLTIL